ncbi:glycosyltransferase family 4 protein [Fictibacillus enclensis]|uniref:glycosyltransferase family 4 protein n=1 Tax=Fictibacillus enclensis TaxID=1017270 RepID=UPI0025A0949D|nr:glycosyltransferase family 4 protein [Fictibacillus enclensis]MDM5337859.1 glycosyltransferase family 4 protein [Fictibacillus enclensis]
MMKILFIYYYPSGGVETLARQRSIALQRYGISFHFLYFWEGPGLQNIKDETTFLTEEEDEIQRIIFENEYDAVLICSHFPLVSKLKQWGYKGKVIYEIQGLGDFAAAEQWFLGSLPYVLNHADAILIPRTPHIIELSNKYYPDILHYCFHNCIDTQTFRHHKMPKVSYPVIGWVGRIEENKNWKDCLAIVHDLKKAYTHLQLWMFLDLSVVKKEEQENFTTRIRNLGLQDSLTVFENIPHGKMPEYYSQIGDSGGFLLSTSKVEGFGYAVLEAMCCRCPVLCTDSDGTKSFIIHDRTGKHYPVHDVHAGIKEALELLENPVISNRIKRNAYEHVQQNFLPSQYAMRFIAMLRSLGLY